MRRALSVGVLVRTPVIVLMCALLSSAAWAQQTASGIAVIVAVWWLANSSPALSQPAGKAKEDFLISESTLKRSSGKRG
jgi:hypothetical protein